MPIDTTNETLLSLTQATKVVPTVNGRRPAIATLWRWCRKGLQGVHLEYVRVGRNIATSREALNRFFNQLAAIDARAEGPRPSTQSRRREPTPRDRQRMLDEADRVLEQAGI